MISFDTTAEAKNDIWSRLSSKQCDFSIYLARCYLHTVEACVSVRSQESIDEFESFILKAIDLLESPDMDGVNGLLHMGNQIVRQVLIQLIKNGLVTETPSGVFSLTEQGRQTLETGQRVKLNHKRHLFHFMDAGNGYLRLTDPRNRFLMDLSPHETPDHWRFNIETLQKCFSETDQWKRQRQFPLELHELILPSSENEEGKDPLAESTLVIDKAQLFHCAIFVKFDQVAPIELMGYPLSPDGQLRNSEPLFDLKSEEMILSVFPHIHEPPPENNFLESLFNFIQKHSLGTIAKEDARQHMTHTSLKVSDDDEARWAQFYWAQRQGSLFFEMDLENHTRMTPLVIERPSDKQQQVNHLFEFNEMYLSKKEPVTILAYNNWLAQRPHLTDVPLRKLVSLAWDLENYRLAYEIAEIEDMVDVEL